MPSGGARGRSGPAPDPDALRRDRDESGWATLPAAGRAGDPPTWPLARPTKRELVLWEQEWRRPQAVMWERNGQELEVALYVRAVRTAEAPGASPPARTLVVRQMETLGISLTGLARNRWRIGAVAGAVAGGSGVVSQEEATSARGKFVVVPGGADAPAA